MNMYAVKALCCIANEIMLLKPNEAMAYPGIDSVVVCVLSFDELMNYDEISIALGSAPLWAFIIMKLF